MYFRLFAFDYLSKKVNTLLLYLMPMLYAKDLVKILQLRFDREDRCGRKRC